MNTKPELVSRGDVEVILIDGKPKLERVGDKISITCDVKELSKIYDYFVENSTAFYYLPCPEGD